MGPQVKPVELHFGRDHLLLCVVFWPGGLHRLLDVPVQELVDIAVEGRALLGSAVADVESRLAELTDYAAMLASAEAFLLEALRRQHRRPERPHWVNGAARLHRGAALSR
ncbi:hypothetical protein BXP70_13545 [Hymenobacter crusticola]|uniref:Uncharacterized protein n=1 Tax=Hymenobacter crusticola TaxID=1770526 RepID=A0A243WCN6_9BACT|nr:hypothetical protein BXP70_13545 [Hymenobacter crusticola]